MRFDLRLSCCGGLFDFGRVANRSCRHFNCVRPWPGGKLQNYLPVFRLRFKRLGTACAQVIFMSLNTITTLLPSTFAPGQHLCRVGMAGIT